MHPGEYILAPGTIGLNEGHSSTLLTVVNTGDRPVQVGSHFHFFEVNRAMALDREKAYGMRLDIPAGTAVRFEPGEEKEVHLVPIGGAREVHGFSGLVNGSLDDERVKAAAMKKISDLGFKNNTP